MRRRIGITAAILLLIAVAALAIEVGTAVRIRFQARSMFLNAEIPIEVAGLDPLVVETLEGERFNSELRELIVEDPRLAGWPEEARIRVQVLDPRGSMILLRGSAHSPVPERFSLLRLGWEYSDRPDDQEWAKELHSWIETRIVEQVVRELPDWRRERSRDQERQRSIVRLARTIRRLSGDRLSFPDLDPSPWVPRSWSRRVSIQEHQLDLLQRLLRVVPHLSPMPTAGLRLTTREVVPGTLLDRSALESPERLQDHLDRSDTVRIAAAVEALETETGLRFTWDGCGEFVPRLVEFVEMLPGSGILDLAVLSIHAYAQPEISGDEAELHLEFALSAAATRVVPEENRYLPLLGPVGTAFPRDEFRRWLRPESAGYPPADDETRRRRAWVRSLAEWCRRTGLPEPPMEVHAEVERALAEEPELGRLRALFRMKDDDREWLGLEVDPGRVDRAVPIEPEETLPDRLRLAFRHTLRRAGSEEDRRHLEEERLRVEEELLDGVIPIELLPGDSTAELLSTLETLEEVLGASGPRPWWKDRPFRGIRLGWSHEARSAGWSVSGRRPVDLFLDARLTIPAATSAETIHGWLSAEPESFRKR